MHSWHTVTFDMGNTDIVVDGHPGVLANRRAATDLTEIITELINQEKIMID